MTQKEMPSCWQAAPGTRKANHPKYTTTWCLRQLVKIALPYIAAIVTRTKHTDWKSRFLDRLIVMAEGGVND